MGYIINVRGEMTPENETYLRERGFCILVPRKFRFVVIDLGCEELNHYQVEYVLEKLHELGYDDVKVKKLLEPTPHKQYKAVYVRTDGYEIGVEQGWLWTREAAEKMIDRKGETIKRIVGDKLKLFKVIERDYFTSPESNGEYNGKQVYNRDTWCYDIADVGDYVTSQIAEDAGNCVPPIEYNNNMIQCGEPASTRIDEKGNGRYTYATFIRIKEDIWEYRGNCFAHEILERGEKIPYVA